MYLFNNVQKSQSKKLTTAVSSRSDKCAPFSQCQYFTVTSKECYKPRLQTVITCVDGQANIHIVFTSCIVEWSGTMLPIDVTQCSSVTQQFFTPRNFVVNSICHDAVRDDLYYGATFVLTQARSGDSGQGACVHRHTPHQTSMVLHYCVTLHICDNCHRNAF